VERVEWNPAKAEANQRKHGIDFLDAIRIFETDNATYPSNRSGEERYVSVGSVEGRIVAVVWTPREPGVRRIISARKARRGEAEQYRKSLGQGP